MFTTRHASHLPAAARHRQPRPCPAASHQPATAWCMVAASTSPASGAGRCAVDTPSRQHYCPRPQAPALFASSAPRRGCGDTLVALAAKVKPPQRMAAAAPGSTSPPPRSQQKYDFNTSNLENGAPRVRRQHACLPVQQYLRVTHTRCLTCWLLCGHTRCGDDAVFIGISGMIGAGAT
jgi:hypothetical protein